MRVISKTRLRKFWERSDASDSEGPLKAWYGHVSSRTIHWSSWGDVKAEFGTASLVGSCVVFNIGGNKFRLITRILYPSHKVLILKVMTHVEYDEDKWKTDCHCYQTHPIPSRQTLRKQSGKKSSRRTGK